MKRLSKLLPLLLLLASCILFAPTSFAQDDIALDDDVLGSVLDEIPLDGLVEVEPPPSELASIGGPLALVAFAVLLMLIFMKLVPFKRANTEVFLYQLPTGIRRGLAMATIMYGIAFALGGVEVIYQMQMHGDIITYFDEMSVGKLVAFTHAHLFGFTTSFLIIGIPFSLQFSHLRWYQAMFPIGLTAALIDVMSWWGIKFIAPSFEYVSMLCGIIFAFVYFFMLVGLLRVLLFPWVIWPSDKNRRQRFEKHQQQGFENDKIEV